MTWFWVSRSQFRVRVKAAAIWRGYNNNIIIMVWYARMVRDLTVLP